MPRPPRREASVTEERFSSPCTPPSRFPDRSPTRSEGYPVDVAGGRFWSLFPPRAAPRQPSIHPRSSGAARSSSERRPPAAGRYGPARSKVWESAPASPPRRSRLTRPTLQDRAAGATSSRSRSCSTRRSRARGNPRRTSPRSAWREGPPRRAGFPPQSTRQPPGRGPMRCRGCVDRDRSRRAHAQAPAQGPVRARPPPGPGQREGGAWPARTLTRLPMPTGRASPSGRHAPSSASGGSAYRRDVPRSSLTSLRVATSWSPPRPLIPGPTV